MTIPVIQYDRELPEIPGRVPWERPDSHLVKDSTATNGWRIQTGRRPSERLLVPRIREAVDAWRNAGYPNASDVTRRLFQYWFDDDHEVTGFGTPFRYYFCQREAIETLAWLIEIAGHRDTQPLIHHYATLPDTGLIPSEITFQTTTDGQRRVSLFSAELRAERTMSIPPQDLRRYALKIATGAGKTWVMAMAIVWSHFHKLKVPGSELSTNFLIVSPNIIVYQRLEKDFANNSIFNQIPLIPPEWRNEFSPTVILRGDPTEPITTGNLFLTNIQQIYESREQEWEPENAIEALLGKKPTKASSTNEPRTLLERIKSLQDIVVLNDEAHHVHSDDLEWNRSLLAIHQALPNGLSLWLDLSATPKDQSGLYFPWTVCDYPLAQAVEDRIVKAPLIVDREGDADRPSEDPDGVTQKNVVDKYGYWIRAAVTRWKDHLQAYGQLGIRPVLFIMTEQNTHADAIGKYLLTDPDFGLDASEVLVIHTSGPTGEIRTGDIGKARAAARDIDQAQSKIKAIVSVMMLREGWDVRNVSVVLGLRPFSATAEILPEQVIGRGLRLMAEVSPDRTQTLEVIGTPNLLKVLREQLEAEGVGTSTTTNPPTLPIYIEPVQEKADFNIAIPITKPSLEFQFADLSKMQIDQLKAILAETDVSRSYSSTLRVDFATTETQVHRVNLAEEPAPARDILSSITQKVIQTTKMTGQFSTIYPIVRDYVANQCFANAVNVEDVIVRSHLARLELQESIAQYLASEIARIAVQRRELQFDRKDFQLSETKRFGWRRDLQPTPVVATKTIFNFVATYNNFERRFAQFLDQAGDVKRFAALGTTEQGDSGVQFRVDYLKPNGSIGFYYPDWVAVQLTDKGEVNWIIETKGRVWADTVIKDEAMELWCNRVTQVTGDDWRYTRVNQTDFDAAGYTAKLLSDLLQE